MTQTVDRQEQIRQYYNESDDIYRQFWDHGGSLHWGIFEDSDLDSTTYLDGCTRLDQWMRQLMWSPTEMGTKYPTQILDVGCGNGVQTRLLGTWFDVPVVGIDVSDRRIANASRYSYYSTRNVNFETMSVLEIPSSCDGQFSHVWSQAVLYNIPDPGKKDAFAAVHRVLQDDGVFVIDDLFAPKNRESRSIETNEKVYDRLMFDSPYTFEAYGRALEEAGFSTVAKWDLTEHLARSYDRLRELARTASERARDQGEAAHLFTLSEAYVQMSKAARGGELGWGLFCARK